MRRVARMSPMGLPLLFLWACASTTYEIRNPDGSIEYVVSCGETREWDLCYDRAKQVCPAGYITLSRDVGFNRKELRIACTTAPAQK